MGYLRLKGYKDDQGLQENKGGYKRLHGVKRGLQGVTREYRGLQGVTKG